VADLDAQIRIVQTQLFAFSKQQEDALLAVIGEQAKAIAAEAASYLPKRTGKTASSVTGSRSYLTRSGSVHALIKGNALARLWERGFGGHAVEIPAHERRGHRVAAHPMNMPHQIHEWLGITIEAQAGALQSAILGILG
jgi:hypothetical protein